jgi:DMSO/TMAO reductase YedYZ molybdopterin-dependent catalytic subunit
VALAHPETAEPALRAVASDGFAVTLSASQVVGEDIVTFDPQTREPTTAAETPNPVLAYQREGQWLSPEQGGPLRLAVITPTASQVTEGHLWVKSVTRLELMASVGDWSLRLVGARTDTVSRTLFESGAAPGCHQARWIDPGGRAWTGIPLWRLVGWVDDENVHQPGAFNRDLAAGGYQVEVVAADDQRVRLSSTRLAADDSIILANQADDAPPEANYAPLRLVGTGLTTEEQLGQVSAIILHLP